MKVLFLKGGTMSLSTKDSKQPQITGSGSLTEEKLSSKKLPVMGGVSAKVGKSLIHCSWGTLVPVTGEVIRRVYGNNRVRLVVQTRCVACGKVDYLLKENLVAGRTKSCRCQCAVKYGRDKRAASLGARYDCMIQRCYRDSHKQSQDYKGKGIKVLFESREHFVKWALATWPDTDFKGLEFDRIDNKGHYSPENLRLVPSSENKRNRAHNVRITYQGKTMFWADWPSPYAPRKTQHYASKGLTGEQIIQTALQSISNKRKNWRGLASRLKELGYMTS